MQDLFVFLVVGVAAAFVARRLYKSVKRQDTCACGCPPGDPKQSCCDKSPPGSRRAFP